MFETSNINTLNVNLLVELVRFPPAPRKPGIIQIKCIVPVFIFG